MKKPNKGVQASFLHSNLKIKADGWRTVVENHTGSLEARSRTGSITANLIIPEKGFCKCFSESGTIKIKIPEGTSANIILKTVSGKIIYRNLNINIKTYTPGEVSGTLGRGGAEIYLETNSSDIVLEGF